MAYETDPAGLGVGKRYGPLNLGGMQGALHTDGAKKEAVFEISFEELSASGAQVVKMHPRSVVTGVFVDVSEAFGVGDTFAVKLAGTMITSAVVSVETKAVLNPALSATPADYTSGDTWEDLTIDTALIDAGTPATGFAKVIVSYTTA